MITNVEVEANNSENGISLIRRFSRRVIESGILPKAKSNKARKRPLSKFLKKQKALKSLSKKAEYEKLEKLGKIVPKKRGRRR